MIQQSWWTYRLHRGHSKIQIKHDKIIPVCELCFKFLSLCRLGWQQPLAAVLEDPNNTPKICVQPGKTRASLASKIQLTAKKACSSKLEITPFDYGFGVFWNQSLLLIDVYIKIGHWWTVARCSIIFWSWWFQPIWKICSSHKIISPNRDENKHIFETTTQLLANITRAQKPTQRATVRRFATGPTSSPAILANVNIIVPAFWRLEYFIKYIYQSQTR